MQEDLALVLQQPEQSELFVARPVGLAALGAEAARQALGDDAVDRACQQPGLDAHVLQPRDRAGRVVGVEGREHEVAGHARLHRDPGRLLVADLADEQHVGVAAQDRPEPSREGQPALG